MICKKCSGEFNAAEEASVLDGDSDANVQVVIHCPHCKCEVGYTFINLEDLSEGDAE